MIPDNAYLYTGNTDLAQAENNGLLLLAELLTNEPHKDLLEIIPDELCFLSENDFDYLKDDEKWMKRLLHRPGMQKEESFLRRSIQSFITSIQEENNISSKHILDFFNRKIYEKEINTRYPTLINGEDNRDRSTFTIELRACLFATLTREIILLMGEQTDQDTSKQRVEFFKEVLCSEDYALFSDAAKTPEEKTYLFRFERALLIATLYLKVYHNTRLLLAIGNLLEGTNDAICYQIVSNEGSHIKFRRKILDHIVPKALQKKPREPLLATSYTANRKAVPIPDHADLCAWLGTRRSYSSLYRADDAIHSEYESLSDVGQQKDSVATEQQESNRLVPPGLLEWGNDDIEYLKDKEAWLRRLLCRDIIVEEIKGPLKNLIDTVFTRIEDASTSDDLIAEQIFNTHLFKDIDVALRGKNLHKTNIDNTIIEVKACILATVMRDLILQDSLKNGNDTKNERREFWRKISGRGEYASFFQDLIAKSKYNTISEIVYLSRFERAIRIAITLIKKNNIKGLLLKIGALLEGSPDNFNYITGGNASKQTRCRVIMIEKMAGLLPKKRTDISRLMSVNDRENTLGLLGNLEQIWGTDLDWNDGDMASEEDQHISPEEAQAFYDFTKLNDQDYERALKLLKKYNLLDEVIEKGSNDPDFKKTSVENLEFLGGSRNDLEQIITFSQDAIMLCLQLDFSILYQLMLFLREKKEGRLDADQSASFLMRFINRKDLSKEDISGEYNKLFLSLPRENHELYVDGSRKRRFDKNPDVHQQPISPEETDGDMASEEDEHISPEAAKAFYDFTKLNDQDYERALKLLKKYNLLDEVIEKGSNDPDFKKTSVENLDFLEVCRNDLEQIITFSQDAIRLCLQLDFSILYQLMLFLREKKEGRLDANQSSSFLMRFINRKDLSKEDISGEYNKLFLSLPRENHELYVDGSRKRRFDKNPDADQQPNKKPLTSSPSLFSTGACFFTPSTMLDDALEIGSMLDLNK